ncbi:MAG: cupin domain-containing protein [Oscillospiraceae bacterium]|nr:cupin domain-containing protein [Oscillospiraceae bacterium]
MFIDYENLLKMSMEEFRGGTGTTHERIFADNLNRIAKLTLEPGASIGLHRHTTSSEMVFVILGKAKVICDGEEEHLRMGQCHYCPMGSEHTIINEGQDVLVVFDVVPEHTGHGIEEEYAEGE